LSRLRPGSTALLIADQTARLFVEHSDFKKLDNYVSFPLTVDIAPFFAPARVGAPATSTNLSAKAKKLVTDIPDSVNYELSAIVVHLGSMGGGHYSASRPRLAQADRSLRPADLLLLPASLLRAVVAARSSSAACRLGLAGPTFRAVRANRIRGGCARPDARPVDECLARVPRLGTFDERLAHQDARLIVGRRRGPARLVLLLRHDRQAGIGRRGPPRAGLPPLLSARHLKSALPHQCRSTTKTRELFFDLTPSFNASLHPSLSHARPRLHPFRLHEHSPSAPDRRCNPTQALLSSALI
jgi:hypothetical protein